MEFEIKEGVYEKAERCYFDIGIAPTLTTVNTDEKIIITEKEFSKDIKESYIIDDLYANREPRLYTECPTLRSERYGLKVLEEMNNLEKD